MSTTFTNAGLVDAILAGQTHEATMTHVDLLLAELERAGVEPGPQCRVCECTEDAPCPDGCHWVEADLCSACARRLVVLVPAEFQ
jgi:hypothetical protein